METLLQQLEQLENIFTLAAVMTTLCFIFLAWHIIMTWLYYKNNESENYKKYNLEFMNEQEQIYQKHKQDATHTKIDILHHEINKNNYHVEMELMDIHKELEKLNKKVGKK